MKCRKCGKGLSEVGGFLERVSPKGEPGVWECRPDCNVSMTDSQKLEAAVSHREPLPEVRTKEYPND